MPGVSKPRFSGTVGGSVLVLGGCVLFGTVGTAQAFAPPGTPPPVLGAVRLLTAAGVLCAYAWARGYLKPGMRWPPVTTTVLAVSTAAYQVLLLSAVHATGVAVGTLVALGTAPVIAGFLGFMVRRERPGVLWTVATAGAVGGCALLILDGPTGVDATGVAFALGAGLAAAAQVLSGKELLDVHRPEAVLAVAFGLAGLLLSPLLFLGDTSWLLDPRGLAIAFHLGVVVSGLAFVVYMRGLAAVPAASGVTLGLAEPVVAAGLGVAVLGERLAASGVVGAGLVIASLAGVTLGPRLQARRRRPPALPAATAPARVPWWRGLGAHPLRGGAFPWLHRRPRR